MGEGREGLEGLNRERGLNRANELARCRADHKAGSFSLANFLYCSRFAKLVMKPTHVTQLCQLG